MNTWAEEELNTLELGDKRLDARLFSVLTRMYDSPQASVKAACNGWAETIAAYRLCSNPEVTPGKILEAHREAIATRVRGQASVLAIQDTTEVDFTSKKALQGRGPLSDLTRQGFFAHASFIASAEGLALGVWDVDYITRDPEKHGQSVERKKLPFEEKESHRWLKGYLQACELAARAPEAEVISCADREGDIYELFHEWQRRKQEGLPVAELLIRSKQDRRLLEVNGESCTQALREALGAQAALGGSVELGAPGPARLLRVPVSHQEQYVKDKHGNRIKKIRSQREATLELRSCRVTLRPPERPDRKLDVVRLQVVMVREKNPPAGEDPIEWILLTTKSVETFEEAEKLVALYLLRWSIEIFFPGIEDRLQN